MFERGLRMIELLFGAGLGFHLFQGVLILGLVGGAVAMVINAVAKIFSESEE